VISKNIMQGLTQEVYHSFEAFYAFKAEGSGTRNFSTDSISNSTNAKAHELRRIMRRLERSLSQLEAYCYTNDLKLTFEEQQILQEATPILLGIATAESIQCLKSGLMDWMHDETIQIQENLFVISIKLLFLVEMEDSDADALLDRLGEELFRQQTASYSTSLVELMKLLHLRWKNYSLIPNISDDDCLWLVTIMTRKLINELKLVTHEREDFVLCNLLTDFLQHLTCVAKVYQSMRDWYASCIASPNGSVSPEEIETFFVDLNTLGQELIESLLDLCGTDDANEFILSQAESTVALAEVLELGFQLNFGKHLRSLFVALVNTCIDRRIENASSILISIARKVLISLDSLDHSVKNAAAMLLYITLNSHEKTQDLSFLYEACQDYLPSVLMTSLILPIAGDVEETQLRLVQLCPKSSPWNSIVARNVTIPDIVKTHTDKALQNFVCKYAPFSKKKK
jgi:hypothetical protein